MLKFLNSEFIERLLFAVIVIGVLMSVIGGFRFLDLSNQISENEAAQLRAQNGEVAVENTNEGFSLMQSDLERRRLVNDRFNMMVVGGIGLALIGVGWMATDIMRSRRKKQNEDVSSQSVAEATS